MQSRIKHKTHLFGLAAALAITCAGVAAIVGP